MCVCGGEVRVALRKYLHNITFLTMDFVSKVIPQSKTFVLRQPFMKSAFEAYKQSDFIHI